MAIAIITIHGIGEQTGDFANTFYSKFSKQVNFETYHLPLDWGELISEEEHILLDRFKNLHWKRLRRWFIDYAGDAIAYRPGSALHQMIHDKLHATLNRINGQYIIVAHSLGTVIASDFLWDLSQTEPETLNRLGCLITLGSPLAIWGLQYPNGGEPVNVPKWLNVYSPEDIIGYPLKHQNEKYEALIGLEDIPFRAGGLLTRWNPASHAEYLYDSKLIRLLAEKVNKCV